MKCLLILWCCSAAQAGNFIFIHSGVAEVAGATIRVDDFEMLDCPVTNAEYVRFIHATGHRAPLYWKQGKLSSGMENLPVVYVNRADAEAYVQWLSKKEGRIHRLPTLSEFEYAARAGQPGAIYPWGTGPPEGRANYNSGQERSYAQWKQFLKPVRTYPPNPWGLYDIAGNVWQLVETHSDPAQPGYNFRKVTNWELERAIVGGSWARSEAYLRIGVRASASPGVLHPDIGFRVVREPAGSTHFRLAVRRVVALPAGSGSIFLSWQILPGDVQATGFHVYRSPRRDAAGDRITTEPIIDRTSFVDVKVVNTRKLFYRVRPVAPNGQEGAPSEWTGVDPSAAPTRLAAVFEANVKQGGIVPAFGDLDGDGRLDAILRLDNGIREMSRDPGVPVELEAFNSYGKSLWRRPLVWHDHCYGNANNVPVLIYDLDGDGKGEVIARVQEGDRVYLAVLDGLTGRVLRKTPWTAMVSDHARTSTRIHLSIAYLDGKHPAIITQTGLYENEVIEAFDTRLRRLWRFNSLAETNGSGSHRIEIADVDGDGRDEVFDGSTLLNPDGKVRWSIYREHADIVSTKHILPDAPGRQVFYAIESNAHAGAYLVDARTGKLLWKHNREEDPRWEHAHIGWVSDIWDGSPGMEIMTNRDGHEAKDLVLFASDGRILMNPFPRNWRPISWTGGPVRDLVSTDGTKLGRFTGKGVDVLPGAGPNDMKTGDCNTGADLLGDFRDELVCIGTTRAGNPAVFVFTNTDPVRRKAVARTSSREYRLWIARNMGGGYPSYFEWEPPER